MGTHAAIYILDEHNIPLVSIYHHYDGYPEGVGQSLYDLLKNRGKCNRHLGEIDRKDHWKYQSNGIDDLAALAVWYLKDDNRNYNVYLSQPPRLPEGEINRKKMLEILEKHADEHGGCEYLYAIDLKRNKENEPEYRIRLEHREYLDQGESGKWRTEYRKIFEGNPEELAAKFNLKEDNILASKDALEADKLRKRAQDAAEDIEFASNSPGA